MKERPLKIPTLGTRVTPVIYEGVRRLCAATGFTTSQVLRQGLVLYLHMWRDAEEKPLIPWELVEEALKEIEEATRRPRYSFTPGPWLGASGKEWGFRIDQY